MAPAIIKCVPVLAALVAAGGATGYVQSGSIKSLVAGLLSAAILAAAYWVESLELAFTTTALLAVVFGMRFRKTAKFMPSGLMLIVCLVSMAIFLYALAEKRRATLKRST